LSDNGVMLRESVAHDRFVDGPETCRVDDVGETDCHWPRWGMNFGVGGIAIRWERLGSVCACYSMVRRYRACR